MTSFSGKHCDEEQLRAYIDGACDSEMRAAVGRHLDECDDCSKCFIELCDRLADTVAALAPLQSKATGAGGGSAGRDSHSEAARIREVLHTSAHEIAIPGYEITRELGRGGMGLVYAAVQLSTRREVALKVLLGGPFSGERAKWRFEHEVRILAPLRHPNIAQVYEAGLHEGRYWFSMELIDGKPLDVAIESMGLGFEDRIALMASVCAAVGALHELGVVHRDLKPSNILVSRDGEPHLLDFGLAKVVDAQQSPDVTYLQTGVGELLGTVTYMAPEQVACEPGLVSARSDVYALGVILYHLVTGQLPYEVGGRIDQVVRNIATVEPTPPSRRVPGMHSDIEAIILKALAKDPEQRYATAMEMAMDLRRYVSGEPVAAKAANALYRLRKSLERYRYHLMGAEVLVAAIAGSVLITWACLSPPSLQVSSAVLLMAPLVATVLVTWALLRRRTFYGREETVIGSKEESLGARTTRSVAGPPITTPTTVAGAAGPGDPEGKSI